MKTVALNHADGGGVKSVPWRTGASAATGTCCNKLGERKAEAPSAGMDQT